MADNFWTSANVEPKRNYRFKVQLGSGAQFGIVWFAKSADKPKFSQEVTEHDFLNHKFKFPGRIKWEDITVELVDPVNPDAMARTLALIADAGYKIPAGASVASVDAYTMSKEKAVAALQSVTIQQLDNIGNTLERWTLKNAFLSKAEFSKLDYSSEDMSTITLTFAYDWAQCDLTPPGATKESFFTTTAE